VKRLFIVTALCVGSILSGCTAARPSNLGVRDGRLAACPDNPNCVSSQSTDTVHAVAPLIYTGTATDAFTAIRKIIAGMKRAVVVEETDAYLHIEFTSALFRLVDDVEFIVDDAEKKIHIRSASRIGYSDLGVNRKRIEQIRLLWLETRPAP
jgi:uncharacterized protein (DUF1499 family)